MDLSLLQSFLKNTKKDWNYITPYQFYHQYYKKNKKYTLLDLRKKKDYDKYHIKGSKNIFWLDILDEKNLKELPKKEPIFLICYVGHTSTQVLVLLKLLGYNVISIKFGYGVTPSFEVPVAGWCNYNYPVEQSCITKK